MASTALPNRENYPTACAEKPVSEPGFIYPFSTVNGWLTVAPLQYKELIYDLIKKHHPEILV